VKTKKTGMTNNLECPINFVLINQNKVRLTAFSVFVLAAVYIITGSVIVAAWITIDFGLRAFKLGQFSLLNGISNTIIDFGGIETLPVNEAPKIFAAKIGLLISSMILTAELTGFVITAQVIAGLLALFAFLESVKGFCAGCYIYTFYTRLSNKEKNTGYAESTPH
jgi:hypothetical protein